VIEAANRGYERSNVPLPSPGVGGACLEKDPFILLNSVQNQGASLVRHARAVSETMINFVADNTIAFLKENLPMTKKPKVLVLGFAFKGRPVTSDMRGSTTLPLVKKIQQHTKNIHGYDPVVKRSEITALNVKHVKDLKKGFEGADAVIVMNNHPEFEDLKIRPLLALANKPCLLFDTWGLYEKAEVEKVRGARYRRL
jgi:UDP-N-acetyl-D-mannosaminuronic acid dehydrogenase